MHPSPLSVVVKILGTQAELAAKLGVTPALISQWITGRRSIAPRHCRAIERATSGDVTRYDLRPDIFGTALNDKAEASHAA